jgi:hypothetical protein
MVIGTGFANVVVPQGVGDGVPLGDGVAVGEGVAVGTGVGEAPPVSALKLPIRKRHPLALVVGTYSFTCQKVRSSVGSIEREV